MGRAGIIILALGLAGCGASTPPPPPPGTPGVMNVADAAIAGGDPAMALKLSRAVLATDPKNLDALYHEASAYYAVNRCMDAVAAYQLALTIDTGSSDAQTGIGRCLLRRDAAAAEAAFAAAVHDAPGNAAALNDLGVARDLQGHHTAAQPVYRQALLLDPGDTATEVNLGMSLALAGKGAEALQYLGPLAASGDATAKIREDYAAALLAEGRPAQARQVLAVDLPPDKIDILMNDFAAAIGQGDAPLAPTQPVVMVVPVSASPIAPISLAALAAPPAP